MKAIIGLVLMATVAAAAPAAAQSRYELVPSTGLSPTQDRYTIGPSGPGSSLLAPPTIERARPNESLLTPQYEVRPAPRPLYDLGADDVGMGRSRRR
jgi:hypothetical protein